MTGLRSARLLLTTLSVAGIVGSILVVAGVVSGDGTLLFPLAAVLGIAELVHLAVMVHPERHPLVDTEARQGPPPE